MRMFYAVLLLMVITTGSLSGCAPGSRDRLQPDTMSIPKLLNEASVKTRQGNYDQAVALYDKVLSIEPDNLTALANQVVLFSLQNNTAASVNSIERLRNQRAALLQTQLRKSPNNARLLLQYSEIQSSLGNHTQAIDSAQKAVRILPTAHSYFVLANANYRNQDYSAALKYYDRAISLDASMLEAYLARAVNKQRLGDINGAEMDFNTVNRLHSNDGISNH